MVLAGSGGVYFGRHDRACRRVCCWCAGCYRERHNNGEGRDEGVWCGTFQITGPLLGFGRARAASVTC